MYSYNLLQRDAEMEAELDAIMNQMGLTQDIMEKSGATPLELKELMSDDKLLDQAIHEVSRALKRVTCPKFVRKH